MRTEKQSPVVCYHPHTVLGRSVGPIQDDPPRRRSGHVRRSDTGPRCRSSSGFIHGPHALDRALGRVERDHADHSIPLVDDFCAGLAVDLNPHEPRDGRAVASREPLLPRVGEEVVSFTW
jgi:hypothetical protein